MGSLDNPESISIILEAEAASVHCRGARLKNTKVLSKNNFQDTYETDYCVLNEVGEGKTNIYIILSESIMSSIFFGRTTCTSTLKMF